MDSHTLRVNQWRDHRKKTALEQRLSTRKPGSAAAHTFDAA